MRSLILVLFSPFLIIACKSGQTVSNTSKAATQTPLFVVNDHAVYADEFIYAYEKSNKNKGETESVEDYLQLYIDFKLKVADAKKEGLDTLPSYKNELQGYLKDIKKPYLTTEQITEDLIEETYQRLQQEVNASHLLIRVEENAAPEDTLKAWQKIKSVLEKHQAGEDFASLVKEYSGDPSAKSNSGNLGWFTAFHMVYPFESAAYSTEEGEVSEIIRTKFGYHLLKVHEKRKTIGRIKIAHIMLRYPLHAGMADSAATEKKIQEIYKALEAGEDWFALATKHSEDLNTKDQGGSLPWFGAGNLPESLEKVAFELERHGEISQPIESPFGWHILKLEEKRGVGSLESMRESLTRRIQRDQRSELKLSEVVGVLKTENDFSPNKQSYEFLKGFKTVADVKLTEDKQQQLLFSIANEKYTLNEFIAESSRESTVDHALNEFEKKMLLSYEERHLPEKYPEYRMLANEYRDGLLLFEIMSRKVWNKVNSDSTGLKEYFQQHHERYTSQTKAMADIFIFEDTSQLEVFTNPIKEDLYPINLPLEWQNQNKLAQEISSLKWYKDSVYVQVEGPEKIKSTDSASIFSTLKQTFPKMQVVNPIYSDENKIYLHLLSKANENFLKIYEGLTAVLTGDFTVGEREKGVKIPGENGFYHTVNSEGNYQLIHVKNIRPARLKTFEESKPELISDYQDYLENEWLKQLKQENEVIVNKQVLEKLKIEIEDKTL